MLEIPLYQIDAFTSHAFGGNPAAVCPLTAMLPDNLLQLIAAENNLAETAYIVPVNDDEADYLLRWFTPSVEVDLCGHATLAAGHVVLKHLLPELSMVRFRTRMGILTVARDGDKYRMDFPALPPQPLPTPDGIGAAIGAEPLAVLKSDLADRDLLLVYEDEETVRNLRPNYRALMDFAPYGFIATAPGNQGEGDEAPDFVSRCFFPNHGIEEDPVTGSAHCVSGIYWANELGKDHLFARQISSRVGELWLDIKGDRVEISGHAVEVLRGIFTFNQ